jgi:hypothetical protein
MSFEEGPGTGVWAAFGTGMAVDPVAGHLYFTENDRHRIRKATRSKAGDAVSYDVKVVVGISSGGGRAAVNGPLHAARLYRPMGLSVDAHEPNVLYAACPLERVPSIRIINFADQTVRSVELGATARPTRVLSVPDSAHTLLDNEEAGQLARVMHFDGLLRGAVAFPPSRCHAVGTARQQRPEEAHEDARLSVTPEDTHLTGFAVASAASGLTLLLAYWRRDGPTLVRVRVPSK